MALGDSQDEPRLDQSRVRLKGHVSISRTMNLGNYNSIRIEVEEEYDQAELSFEEMLANLTNRLDALLTEKGIVKK